MLCESGRVTLVLTAESGHVSAVYYDCHDMPFGNGVVRVDLWSIDLEEGGRNACDCRSWSSVGG